MASIFSKIVAGDIPCHKVAENDHCLAFLDIMPLAEGHTLVIPKKEVDRIWDLEPSLLAELHVFSQKVALAMEDAVPCQRVGQAVIGLEVPPRPRAFDSSECRVRHQLRAAQIEALSRRTRRDSEAIASCVCSALGLTSPVRANPTGLSKRSECPLFVGPNGTHVSVNRGDVVVIAEEHLSLGVNGSADTT